MVFGKKKPDLSDLQKTIEVLEAKVAGLKQRVEQLELNFSLVIQSSGDMIRRLQGALNKMKQSQSEEQEPEDFTKIYKKKVAKLIQKLRGE